MVETPKPTASTLLPDVIAGFTVALVAIPQSMAYAELMGVPAHYGLYAVALPPLLAAFFASSAWLQTGPVATTSLLAVGALSSVTTIGAPDTIALAGLLAVIVGGFRAAIGLLRGGAISYLMNHAVLRGFILAAALLILSSQLPSALGVQVTGTTVMGRALEALMQPMQWDPLAVGFSVVTLTLIFGGRHLHPMFPGVLVAAGLSLAASVFLGYDGATLAHVPAGLPSLTLDLPWHRTPELLLPGAVIALVGFAEAASIGQTFAEMERVHWDPNREFVGQGVANIVAGLTSGFPIGGSFSRSALTHLAGGRTRLAGAITGATVLCILPFASVLEPLPKAVLGATVIAAVRSLLSVKPITDLWRLSRAQFVIATATFVLTLALAPRVELAVLTGIGISIMVHLWREQEFHVVSCLSGQQLTVRPLGVLWFGSAPAFRRRISETLADHHEITDLSLDVSGLGRVDMSGALMLSQLIESVRARDISVRFVSVPPQIGKILRKVCPDVPLELQP
ncbi:MAG: SulP family inorganic anion transporter [Myxococcales bacterium]|nr:SulP family inorganic anion transporter [Myxococcales bacterium]